MVKKWVYLFHEGRGDMRDLLGGKGAGLAEMTNAGMPVPPGFTITTEACNEYTEANGTFPEGFWDQALAALKQLESDTDKKFGDPTNPLLVSVRSGAKFSMPGMMDTILNLGLNDETAEGLARLTNNERFVFDSYRRFIQMFGKVVMGVNSELFEHKLDLLKTQRNAKTDTDLDAAAMREAVKDFKQIVKEQTGQEFPTDPLRQLQMAIEAVFASWNNRRAVDYRNLNKIPHNLGTAVNVQTMVYGNMGMDSGTGVAFSRNPSTGENELYGEYLLNAQGEDVVAGIRTPGPISAMQTDPNIPGVYDQFRQIARRLEAHYKDMQDMEFTIERGRLYMLQTRTGKRTGPAAVRIAVDLVGEGVIDEKTALQRVLPEQLDQLLHPTIDPNAKVDVVATGLPASPGAATGRVVFDADEAAEMAEKGEKVILVRVETSPEDFHGMVAAEAILTARGGMTSHAAVVARGMGKPAVVGAGSLIINYKSGEVTAGARTIKKGDWMTLDATTGRVILGEVETLDPVLSAEFAKLMEWADKNRRLGVRTNADTPHDAKVARDFGAEGIGLCRTEHMFFEGNRIEAMREMILSDTVEERRRALDKLLPIQKADFVGIFEAMHDLPVTIRTLDPPLHEFLPHNDEEIEPLAQGMGIPAEKIKARVQQLAEANPMLGFRGCRLGIVYPEITEMQARAIFLAAIDCTKRGIKVLPEIMIPLVSTIEELRLQKEIVVRVAEEELNAAGIKLEYKVGTMIELPRAALTADEIAQEAEFFSYGTNDLTQTTFGMSRDDAGKFLPMWVEKKILPEDPFQVIDRKGVGKLMQIGTELGRQTRPDLKVGICGEHGGNPSSVEFCHLINLNYVSASPYRVPIARLAAAHAALENIERDK